MTIAVTAVSGHLGGAIARHLIKTSNGETIIGLAAPRKMQKVLA